MDIIVITGCIIVLVLCMFLFTYILTKPKKKKNQNGFDYNNSLYYKKLFFMRRSEFRFFKAISVLEDEYKIVPKICLKTIIKTNDKKLKNNLNEYVDYAIFNRDFSDVLLLIELTDSMYEPERQQKEVIFKKICDEAGIKFISFTTNKIDEDSAIEKIKEILKNIYK